MNIRLASSMLGSIEICPVQFYSAPHITGKKLIQEFYTLPLSSPYHQDGQLRESG
jgi:hypothetical protein